MDQSKSSITRDDSEAYFGYKRETKHRIFVNRCLHMDKINFFGFDMDYTLAAYKSPQYEELAFRLIQERLISIGYPKEINDFTYDSSFPVRGLWFDKEYGTLLKIDQFGNILFSLRGFKFLSRVEVRHLYPNKFLQLDESRLFVLNTLFNLPFMHMLACLIQYFVNHKDYTVTDKGVKNGHVWMSYRSIFNDVQSAVDSLHVEGGPLKQNTMDNLDEYVHRDERLPIFLKRLKTRAKTFLLTNSEFSYTNKIMEYLLSYPDENGVIPDWTTYFDYIVVDAKKPLFFKEGTVLRGVDRATGQLNLGHHVGPLEQGKIYNGGSCEVFSHLIGARGKDVLYVGDHIFGDILKSKKIVGWRTFLVIPELANEIYVWKKEKTLFDRLQHLDNQLAEIYKDMNIETDEKPDIVAIQKEIRSVAREMEESYGVLGSLFRNGSRQTFFSAQVMRYADIYSFSCLNLTHYPLCYMFRAPSMLMAHESTVSQTDSPIENFSSIMDSVTTSGLCRRSRTDNNKMLEPGSMQVELLKLHLRQDQSPPENRSSSERDDEDLIDDKGEHLLASSPPAWPSAMCPNDTITNTD